MIQVHSPIAIWKKFGTYNIDNFIHIHNDNIYYECFCNAIQWGDKWWWSSSLMLENYGGGTIIMSLLFDMSLCKIT